MPRGPRLDYAGALHHVICRGIERRKIFRTDRDRAAFVDRLGDLVVKSGAGLYAWTLMPNHVHLLLRTGAAPLSELMQKLLGPYATTFNLVHHRAGHLFQGRFKNVLVEDEPYLLELVRYIHLNPVRSRLPVTIDTLDVHPWSGHSVLLGKVRFEAQDCKLVLGQFASTVGRARTAYRRFVRNGLEKGPPPDLDGGGLRRSTRGWELVAKLARGRESWEFDERILGSGEFVRSVIERVGGPELPGRVRDPTRLLDSLCARVSLSLVITPEEVRSGSKRAAAVDARAIISHLAVCHHGLSRAVVGRYLNVARQSVARGLARSADVYAERRCLPRDFLTLVE